MKDNQQVGGQPIFKREYLYHKNSYIVSETKRKQLQNQVVNDLKN